LNTPNFCQACVNTLQQKEIVEKKSLEVLVVRVL